MGVELLAKALVFCRIILKADDPPSIIERLVLFADVLGLRVALCGDSLSSFAVETAVHLLGLRREGFIDVHNMFICGALNDQTWHKSESENS